MRRFLAAAALLAAAAPVAARAQRPTHTFRIAEGAFRLDGRPLQLISGELHYARIPREYWRQRLRMARAMGLNTVATYVFWNFHELRPGVFDFRTGMRDLPEFLREAQEEGLWVILRPGPYACAEWDFGGFPAWLAKDTTLRVRSRDPRFLRAARRYVRALGHAIRPWLVTHGGPILMVQAENEYGSFGSDSLYLARTRRMFSEAGVDVPLFTADGDWLFDRGAIPGLLPAANGETDYDSLVARVNRFHGGRGPYLVAEFYPGWLDHWGEPFAQVADSTFLPAYDSLLARGASVNLYMFHGGTSFGFWAGANYSKANPIEPDLTSYDYDAPLSEAGHTTPKFFALRDVIRKHVGYPIPPVPDSPPVMALPAVPLTPAGDLFSLAAAARPVRSVTPPTFEALGLAGGYVLYRHRFRDAVHGTLHVPGLRDYALVYVNRQLVGELDRRVGRFALPISVPAGGVLDLLVETEGRINYGAEMVRNRKGIIAPVTVDSSVVTGWAAYPLPFGSRPRPARSTPGAAPSGLPTVYRGSFALDSVADTFLDLRGWGKGIVFVNGHNLGRYWRLGPQQTLYLPGPWLHRGSNDIVIFEEWNDDPPGTIAGLDHPILTELHADAGPRLPAVRR